MVAALAPLPNLRRCQILIWLTCKMPHWSDICSTAPLPGHSPSLPLVHSSWLLPTLPSVLFRTCLPSLSRLAVSGLRRAFRGLTTALSLRLPKKSSACGWSPSLARCILISPSYSSVRLVLMPARALPLLAWVVLSAFCLARPVTFRPSSPVAWFAPSAVPQCFIACWSFWPRLL